MQDTSGNKPCNPLYSKQNYKTIKTKVEKFIKTTNMFNKAQVQQEPTNMT